MNRIDLSRREDRSFAGILARQAREAGDNPWLVTDSASITFAEAEDLTNRIATGLARLGLGPGDRIALFMGNRPELVLIALAANKLGAVWTPICTDYRGSWLADTLSRCEATLLATDSEHAPHLREHCAELLASTPLIVVDGDDANNFNALSNCPPQTPQAADAGDVCAILWTSGTTGRSKGVMQCYNNWTRAITQGASRQFDSRDGDVIYCTLPLYNSAAWITSILRALLEGITVVIEPAFSASRFWERIAHFGATQTFVLGAMGVFLLNQPARDSDAATPLREVQVVPLPPHLWQPFAERFDCRLIRAGLGQSECLLVLTQIDNRADVPVYALGFPVADAEVALLDEDGDPVADGEVGEICIRECEPDVLFKGYFNDPEATAHAYHGDWYRSGDLGRRDPDTGAYFYCDRKKDAVRYGGRNISTLEVESVARRHPAVQDVAAFGIPSAEVESEDELKLNVVLREGADTSAEDIAAFINDNGPYFFVPRYLEFVSELPYTPNGKVQKYRLRAAGVGAGVWDRKTSGFKLKR